MTRWFWLAAALGLTCAPRAAAPSSGSADAPPPIAVPGVGSGGCVESQELKAFVLALETERQRARAAARAALGLEAREEQGVFEPSSPDVQVGQTYEVEGQRYAAVAWVASETPPAVSLVLKEGRVHPLEERPQAHAVPLLVCGERACPGERAVPRLPPRRLLAVPLARGVELGPPLPLSYDFWWAQVSYDRKRSCPAGLERPASAGAVAPGAK